jgi:hypothetical protein
MHQAEDAAILYKKQLTQRIVDLQPGALANVAQPAQAIANDRFIVAGVLWLSR